MSKHVRKLDMVGRIMKMLHDEDFELVEGASTLSGAYLKALSQFDSYDDALKHLAVTTRAMEKALRLYFGKELPRTNAETD